MSYRRTALLILTFFPGLSAAAQTQYPVRPVRIVMPSAAGGGIDTLARVVAQRFTEHFGQQFIVDARPGATGIIGTGIVARAAPDGHTLLFAWTAPLAINPGLFEKLPYDVLRDFAPIVLVCTTPNVLVVSPSTSIRSVKEYIEVARQVPGKIRYGSSGTGGSSHLAGELFASLAQVKLDHIPYKGSPPALVDLMAGRIESMFAALAPALPHIRSQRLRAIAVTTSKRSAMLPDLPSVSETVPGYDAETWYGLVAPARTPTAIINRLNRDINEFLREPATVPSLHQMGFEPVGGTSDEFSSYLRSEIAKWGKLIKDINVRAD
jgi:tripartite-type tricarboxylate transporter receptor subunit TctC